MTSLSAARRWIVPLVVTGAALFAAPAALAVPPNVRPSAGSYASQTPIDVSFTSDQPVTIHYTTDGSTPTASSPTYSSPIHITRTTTLSWLANNAGGETSSGQETYTIDTNPPSVTIAVPADGSTFTQYDAVKAYYWCADAELAYATCDGSVPYEGNVDTSTAGRHTFTVTSYDAAGNRTVKTSRYTVNPAVQGGGGAGGTVPATLNLTLASSPAFGPFTPGVAKDYLTTVAATVTSTAGDATMSVADPSSTATGHLVNGNFVMPQALQVSGPSTAFAPVGGSSAPTTVKTYNGPITNDNVTVTFKQPVASTDALRTGTYGKTLTFTLSTTNP